MGVIPSPPPTRTPSGATTDWPFGPLAASGYGNPFFYHGYSDDFDNSLSATGLWTVSAGGAGTVANAAGDGGLGLLTTAGASGNYESIQLPSAGFTLPQGALFGKKAFFLTRIQLSDVVGSTAIVGLCNVTTTPFAAVADGVYFIKNTGAATLSLVSAIGGVLTTTVIPAAAYSLANATFIDLAWHITHKGELMAYVGAQLVGYTDQSGSGAVNSAGVSLSPVLGACVRVTGLTFSTANLAPTIAVQTNAVAAKTLTVDFVTAQKER